MRNNGPPLVSVCIPVYNGGAFIRETLESLASQTLRSIEVIVSDNASSDNTREIVEDFQRKDSRFILIKNPVNVGYAGNIAVAVAQTQSDNLAIFHADDVYHPEILERELELLHSNSELAAVFCLPASFSGDVKRAHRNQFFKRLHRLLPLLKTNGAIVGNYEDFLPVLLRYGNFFACPTLLTRRHLYERVGGFTSRYPSNEDLELWIKFLERGWKLGILTRFLHFYRQSDQQGSALLRKKPELGRMYQVLDEMVLSKRSLTANQLRDYQRNRAVGFARVAIQMTVLGNGSAAKEFAAYSRRTARLNLASVWGIAQYFPGAVVQVQFFKQRLMGFVDQLWSSLLRSGT